MFRKLAIVIAIAMLAFITACSSTTSTVNNAAAGTSTNSAVVGAGAGSSASATTCPTSSTKAFAKTKFVADIALAGGAFKRWIYTPAKDGKFKKGAQGKVAALVKAAAAGAFTINRLDAAKNAAEADPTLCKVLVAPLANFGAEVQGLISKAKSGVGSINPSDVTSGNTSLASLHAAASEVGAPFTDNLNTNA
jgi:hypothetical protein